MNVTPDDRLQFVAARGVDSRGGDDDIRAFVRGGAR